MRLYFFSDVLAFFAFAVVVEDGQLDNDEHETGGSAYVCVCVCVYYSHRVV